ncbi:hypothetical protein [Cryptosporangium arvum]|nr:hypothetical protein [Cryptosporangium arvum]
MSSAETELVYVRGEGRLPLGDSSVRGARVAGMPSPTGTVPE